MFQHAKCQSKQLHSLRLVNSNWKCKGDNDKFPYIFRKINNVISSMLIRYFANKNISIIVFKRLKKYFFLFFFELLSTFWTRNKTLNLNLIIITYHYIKKNYIMQSMFMIKEKSLPLVQPREFRPWNTWGDKYWG